MLRSRDVPPLQNSKWVLFFFLHSTNVINYLKVSWIINSMILKKKKKIQIMLSTNICMFCLGFDEDKNLWFRKYNFIYLFFNNLFELKEYVYEFEHAFPLFTWLILTWRVHVARYYFRDGQVHLRIQFCGV